MKDPPLGPEHASSSRAQLLKLFNRFDFLTLGEAAYATLSFVLPYIGALLVYLTNNPALGVIAMGITTQRTFVLWDQSLNLREKRQVSLAGSR